MPALLIGRGADVPAPEGKGRTPVEVAMLRGDREAMALLIAAGASPPAPAGPPAAAAQLAELAGSVEAGEPMFAVQDMRATLRWYEAIGFRVTDRYEDAGEIVFARLAFGGCEFTITPGGTGGPRDVRLWLRTRRVEDIYRQLKARQLH